MFQHARHYHTREKPSDGHDYNFGLLGVLIHLCGDAVNSQFYSFSLLYPLANTFIDIGVIIAAVLMWKLRSPIRFYADPVASMVISFIIFGTAIPLSK